MINDQILPGKIIKSFICYKKKKIILWVIITVQECFYFIQNTNHSFFKYFLHCRTNNYSFRIVIFFFPVQLLFLLQHFFDIFFDLYSKIIDSDTTLSHRAINRLNDFIKSKCTLLVQFTFTEILPFLHNSTYFQFSAIDFHDLVFFKKPAKWCNCLCKNKCNYFGY